jgi:hypothetical protein
MVAMRCAIAPVVLAAGCLSVPAYAPDVAVNYSDDEGGKIVGKQFELQFAITGLRFPIALKIDGEDVLGHEPGPSCLGEDEAGVLISPTPRLSPHGDAHVVTNQLAAVLTGPAVVQVKLDWSTRLDCNPDRAPHGSSTFTAFPDGRIVRTDTFDDTGPELKTSSDCACRRDVPESGGFQISTFWTIGRDKFRDLITQSSIPVPAKGMTVGNNERWSCFGEPSRSVAFGWAPSNLSFIRGWDQSVAFGRDLTLFTTTLPAYSLVGTSALFIEHSDCSMALTRAREYVEPPQLTINGTPVDRSASDGIYASAPGVMPASDRFEVTGSMRSSFAVWLRFPHPVEALRGTFEGETGAWYVPQRVDDSSWIVWVAKPISAGRKIVIEPR